MTVNEYVEKVKEVKKYIRQNVIKTILLQLWHIILYIPFTVYFSFAVIRYPNEVPIWVYIVAGALYTFFFTVHILTPWSSYFTLKVKWVIKNRKNIEAHFGYSIWIDIITENGDITYKIKPKVPFNMDEETCIDAVKELVDNINS